MVASRGVFGESPQEHPVRPPRFSQRERIMSSSSFTQRRTRPSAQPGPPMSNRSAYPCARMAAQTAARASSGARANSPVSRHVLPVASETTRRNPSGITGRADARKAARNATRSREGIGIRGFIVFGLRSTGTGKPAMGSVNRVSSRHVDWLLPRHRGQTSHLRR